MAFPYTFPIVFAGAAVINAGDTGKGADILKTVIRKAGADIKLRGHRGEVGMPHKEVSL